MGLIIKVGNKIYQIKSHSANKLSDCLECDLVDRLPSNNFSFSCKYRKIFKSGDNLCMKVSQLLGVKLNNMHFVKLPLYKILKY